MPSTKQKLLTPISIRTILTVVLTSTLIVSVFHWYDSDSDNEIEYMNCLKLKTALRQRLQMEDADHKSTASDLSGLKKEYADSSIGLPGRILNLSQSPQSIEVLIELLSDKNDLVAIEAAAALALLGDRSGLGLLEKFGADPIFLTNSQIEMFLAKAALIILERPIPQELKKKYCVFLELEQSITECLEHK